MRQKLSRVVDERKADPARGIAAAYRKQWYLPAEDGLPEKILADFWVTETRKVDDSTRPIRYSNAGIV